MLGDSCASGLFFVRSLLFAPSGRSLPICSPSVFFSSLVFVAFLHDFSSFCFGFGFLFLCSASVSFSSHLLSFSPFFVFSFLLLSFLFFGSGGYASGEQCARGFCRLISVLRSWLSGDFPLCGPWSSTLGSAGRWHVGQSQGLQSSSAGRPALGVFDRFQCVQVRRVLSNEIYILATESGVSGE